MNGYSLGRRLLGQARIYDLWDSFSSLVSSAAKVGPDVYKTYEGGATASTQAKTAQAQAAAAAANAAAATQNAIAAQALNPTILGMPQGLVIAGGLGLAALGITLALVKK